MVADLHRGVDVDRRSADSGPQAERDVFACRLTGELRFLEERERGVELPVADVLEDGAVDQEERGSGGGALEQGVRGVLADADGGDGVVGFLDELVDRGEELVLCGAEAQTSDNGCFLGVGAFDERVDGGLLPCHIRVDPEQPVGVVVVEEAVGEGVPGRGHVRAGPFLHHADDAPFVVLVVQDRRDDGGVEECRDLAGVDEGDDNGVVSGLGLVDGGLLLLSHSVSRAMALATRSG